MDIPAGNFSFHLRYTGFRSPSTGGGYRLERHHMWSKTKVNDFFFFTDNRHV